MQRISILAVTAIVLAACSPQDPPISAPSAARTAVPEIDAEPAAMLHAAALTLDTHVDIDPSFATEAIDPLDADIKVNLEKMRAGGLDAAFFIVYVRQTERTPE
ncbi:MAG TPA: hypothetical protein VLD39_11420, partial [Gammaproteobacteria bacterium]|nr:hypothetical protein [Gammaproteobacteria bacterium]